jgi:uncharacterized oxidoreductase
MKLSGNTVLITGGSTGIGLELSKRLIERGNTVIITGRDPAKLDAAKRALPTIVAYQSDAGDPKAIVTLYDKVTDAFPALNILINNAGIMRVIDFNQTGRDLEDLTREIAINFVGPVQMVQQFLPQLKKQTHAAIVNVSSGLAFVPLPVSPIYCATKAALHSFTQSLRVQLKKTNVQVFELAPPATETPLMGGDFAGVDLASANLMSVETLVTQALRGFEKDRLEIRPGQSNGLKLLSRIAPEFALRQLSNAADRMIASAKH